MQCFITALEIWEVNHGREFTVINGKVFSPQHLAVRCIEWSSQGTEVICGTSVGCLYVLVVPEMVVRKRVRSHETPIVRIKLSPNNRFLASGDSSGNVVIYTWNSCEIYLLIKSVQTLNHCFDWHPWISGCLAISKLGSL